MSDCLTAALASVDERLAKARAARIAKAPNRKATYPHVSRLLARMAQTGDSVRTLASHLDLPNETLHLILECERVPRGDKTLAKFARFLGEDVRALTAEIAAIPPNRRLAKVAPRGSEWL